MSRNYAIVFGGLATFYHVYLTILLRVADSFWTAPAERQWRRRFRLQDTLAKQPGFGPHERSVALPAAVQDDLWPPTLVLAGAVAAGRRPDRMRQPMRGHIPESVADQFPDKSFLMFPRMYPKALFFNFLYYSLLAFFQGRR